jgi:multiple sugar transport system substrate-binding protein
MRKLLGLGLVVVLALTMSGIAVAQDVVVLQVWTGSSSPVENEAKEAQVADFEAANPGIDVELLISPDYGTQIQAAFASGDYPDVFTVGQFEFPSLADSGVLLPAGDRIEAPDDLYPGLVAAFTDADGNTYCVPKDFSTLALLYNTDHFDAAGVAYPTSEWTWDDMAAAAATISENVEGVTGLSAAADHNRWMAFFYGNGASLFDESGAVVVNSPEGVAALDFYGSFIANGTGAVPSDLDGSGWNGEAFGRGLAAMTIEGNWAIGYLQNDFPDLNWGVAEIPLSPSGVRGTLTFTECWAVGATTEHPDEAWALVNALTGVDGAMDVATAGFGVMPARPSAATTWLETRG